MMYTNEEDIAIWLYEMGIDNYDFNEDLSINVDDDVDLSRKNLLYLPVQFNTVTGGFYCSFNLLTTCAGFPRKFALNVDASGNKLTNVEGMPKRIGSHCNLKHNNLTSIKGLENIEIHGELILSHNPLTDLRSSHIPRNIEVIKLQKTMLSNVAVKEYLLQHSMYINGETLYSLLANAEFANDLEVMSNNLKLNNKKIKL